MLGWFKKKFGKGKKEVVREVEESPQLPEQEETLPDEQVGDSGPSAEPASVQPEPPGPEAPLPVERDGEEAATAVMAPDTETESHGAVATPERQPVEPPEEVLSAEAPGEQRGELPEEEEAAELPEDQGTGLAEPEEPAQAPDESGTEPPEGEQPGEAIELEGGEAPEVEEPTEETVEQVAVEQAEDPVAGSVEVEEAGAPPEPDTAIEEQVAVEPVAEQEVDNGGSRSMFQRLQDRLSKTRDSLVYRLDTLFLGKKEIDQELFDELEEILITADMGVATTLELLDEARKKVKRDALSDPLALKQILRERILTYIQESDQPAELVMPEDGPFVIMVVGVNGVGKTTSIGKIAAKFVRSGQSVLLVAGDTFRAAAIDQIKIWGDRVGVEVVAREPGSDPSSVVFDGLEYGMANKRDVIIIDTAGRLHTSVNLMEELKKIRRVINKKYPGAPHEVMLVLDATTGQNGISQAKMFNEAVGVTGLTMTKLDGTAKGGIVANVCREIKIPVRFIGIGEQIDDLRDFDPREFVDALFDQQAE